MLIYVDLQSERFCNPVTVSYTGFTITWNKTRAGVTVEAPCTGPGLNGQLQQYRKTDDIRITINLQLIYYVIGNVSRRCIIDDEWDETFNCFREQTGILLDKVMMYFS